MPKLLLNRLREVQLRSERGAILVITTVVMLVLIVVASYSIDTAIWYVHARHLQTQADAAALAGVQQFQYPCTSGTTTTGTTDYKILQAVNQYNGTGLTPATGTTYNKQVPGSTPSTASNTYSSTAHNVIPELNQKNFINQSFPNDKAPSGNALSGSPCTDGVVDVKMTETNAGSWIPSWINPLSFATAPYINKQAQLEIEQIGNQNNAEPFVEPLPNPPSGSVQLVNESTGANIGPAEPVSELVTSGVPDPTTLTGTEVLPSTVPANGLVGMEFTPTNGSTYSSNSTPPYGISYFHTWTAGTDATAPYLEDVWVAPPGTSTCPSSPGTTAASNFVSSSSTTTIQLCATIVFPTAEGGCASLNSNGWNLNMTPGGKKSTVNNNVCSGTGNVTTWTLPTFTVAPNSGGTTVTLDWSQTKSVGTSGPLFGCSNQNKCTGNWGTVQSIYSGAYDSVSAQTSGSGYTLSSSISNSTGNVISSESQASAVGQTVTFTIHSLSFSNASAISSPYVELSFGGNQVNAALECAGSSEGSPQFQQNVASGCQEPYQTTTASCPNSDSPPSCAVENPGNGKLDKDLASGMTARIYCGGVLSGCNPKCNTASAADYNFWTSPNTVSQVVGQKPVSPRLVTLIVTDNNALSNGASSVPVRAFAEFYVTGYSGDPCSGVSLNGTYTDQNSTTLNYTGDDSTSDTGVLLGHFVKYVEQDGSGTGSGSVCNANTLALCIPVFTK